MLLRTRFRGRSRQPLGLVVFEPLGINGEEVTPLEAASSAGCCRRQVSHETEQLLIRDVVVDQNCEQEMDVALRQTLGHVVVSSRVCHKRDVLVEAESMRWV